VRQHTFREINRLTAQLSHTSAAHDNAEVCGCRVLADSQYNLSVRIQQVAATDLYAHAYAVRALH